MYHDYRLDLSILHATSAAEEKTLGIRVLQCPFRTVDPAVEPIKEAESEESPAKPGIAGRQKHLREMTINTALDPPTPAAVLMRQGVASTVVHRSQYEEEEKLPCSSTRGQPSTVSHARSSVGCPKHFVFSGSLLNPGLPTSPNRVALFTGFLREKMGETRFEQARTMLFSAENPLRLLDEERDKLLAVIGKENSPYLPIFKYIINVRSGAIVQTHDFSQALLAQQRHSRTHSMQVPVHRIHSRVPYSTKANQGMAGRTVTRGSEPKAFVSPANSVVTGSSSAAVSPVALPSPAPPSGK